MDLGAVFRVNQHPLRDLENTLSYKAKRILNGQGTASGLLQVMALCPRTLVRAIQENDGPQEQGSVANNVCKCPPCCPWPHHDTGSSDVTCFSPLTLGTPRQAFVISSAPHPCHVLAPLRPGERTCGRGVPYGACRAAKLPGLPFWSVAPPVPAMGLREHPAWSTSRSSGFYLWVSFYSESAKTGC